MLRKTLSTTETAEKLKIKESRVRQLLASGDLEGLKVPPHKYRGEWRIYEDSIIRYMNNRKKAGRPKKLQGGK